MIDIKTATITEKGQIALPKKIRSIKGFDEGSKVAIMAFDDRIEIRPLNKKTESFLTALASEKSLAKDWLSKKDEKAWKNL